MIDHLCAYKLNVLHLHLSDDQGWRVVAEVGWSPASARDWEDFRARLAAEGPRWDAAGTAYNRSPQVPWP